MSSSSIPKKGEPIPRWLKKRLLQAVRNANVTRTRHGYIRLWNKEFTKLHPNRKPYQRWHRLSTELKLNRFLLPEEMVDHIDTNKWNNKIENFEVLSRSQHAKKHTKEGLLRKPKHSDGCKVKKCSGIYFSSGYCKKHYQRWWRYGDYNVVLRRGRPRKNDRSSNGTNARDQKFRDIREAKQAERDSRSGRRKKAAGNG